MINFPIPIHINLTPIFNYSSIFIPAHYTLLFIIIVFLIPIILDFTIFSIIGIGFDIIIIEIIIIIIETMRMYL